MKGRSGKTLACHICNTAIDPTRPIYSCGECLAGATPLLTELLCEKCRQRHRNWHERIRAAIERAMGKKQ